MFPESDARRAQTQTVAPHAPVLFVCGLHRSGTSLVHRCLARHPEVSGFNDTGVPEDEGQHLQTVFAPAYRHGGPGRFGFDPKSHLTEDSPLVTDANREQLLAEWGRHWRAGAGLYVEKSPPNLVRTRFLQAMFPRASFLVVVRHPAAVAGATQKWSRTPSTSLVHHWVVCHETLRADAPHLERVRIVRYEELVADPDGSLAGVYEWLGLSPQPSGEQVRSDVNARYFARWRSRARLLGRVDRALAARRYEHDVRRWGYSLNELERLSPVEPLS
jgi:Sulfotransferase family